MAQNAGGRSSTARPDDRERPAVDPTTTAAAGCNSARRRRTRRAAGRLRAAIVDNGFNRAAPCNRQRPQTAAASAAREKIRMKGAGVAILLRPLVFSVLVDLAATGPAIGAAPPAVVEDLARSFVTESTACERLKARRELLEAAANAPRPRNAPRDDAALRQLQSAAAQFRAACATAEREWLNARTERWTYELSRYDQSQFVQNAGTAAAILYWSERIAWWCGPPAILVLLALLIYDGRRWLRRILGVYAGLAVVLFLGATAIAAAAGMASILRKPITAAPPPLESPHERISGEIAVLANERAALKTEVEQLEDDLGPSPADRDLRQLSRDLAELARLHAFLVRNRRVDLEATANVRAELSATADDAAAARFLRAGAGLGLCLAIGAGGWLRYRTVRMLRARRAATCPACGQRGGLRIDRRTGVARCGVAACGFDFSLAHCTAPRLRLSVLGPLGAGKTHWIAAAARELTAGHYAVRGSTTPSAATAAMEQITGAILDERRPPPATPPGGMPLPIVLRDRDPFGRSDLLVTIAESSSPNGKARRADALLLAIDATQPLETHRKWLAELSTARLPRRMPIVLALTKIDLLAGRETDRFFADLAAIEPSGRSVSRSVIRRRSARTARFVSVLWPGWDASADLGRRDLPWYPVTPVGLNEPGEADLRRRIIEPFATLEPFLGVVHACGYPILA
jgi:hypothetical protein